MAHKTLKLHVLTLLLAGFSCTTPESTYHYDLVLKGGNILDGNGGDPYVADIGIVKDTITYIGTISADQTDSLIDISG